MPSQRRQLNVRMSPETEARLAALVVRMRAVLGIDVTMADVVGAGLVELEKRYPPEDGSRPPDPTPRPRGRPRKEKPPESS